MVNRISSIHVSSELSAYTNIQKHHLWNYFSKFFSLQGLLSTSISWNALFLLVQKSSFALLSTSATVPSSGATLQDGKGKRSLAYFSHPHRPLMRIKTPLPQSFVPCWPLCPVSATHTRFLGLGGRERRKETEKPQKILIISL